MIFMPLKSVNKFYVILIFLILISLNIIKADDSLTSISDNNESTYDLEFNEPLLRIYDVEDGMGLKFKIKNIGDKDITSIILYLNVTGGVKINLPYTERWIGQINGGESSPIIDLEISGFGIGIFSKRPIIHCSIESPRLDNPIKYNISIRLIGPIIFTDESIWDLPEENIIYTLYGPEYSKEVYLINRRGDYVHSWKTKFIQGLGLYLLENGDIIRSCLPYVNEDFIAGGVSGRVEIFDWNGSPVWEFNYSTDQYCLHHDIEPMPNGNILMILWELKSVEEAINEGRDESTVGTRVWSEKIIEVEPIGRYDYDIVWEWAVWDHLIQEYDPLKDNYGVISEHPELIDINKPIGTDWFHINSVDYNEEFDQILLSARHQNEIWIIDHSTTTEEAAGHTGGNFGKGGDLLYRWGNPQVYNRGSKDDQKLFGQHDARWIEEGYFGEGNILIFNNGVDRPDGFYSTVEEIIPPVNENGYYSLNPSLAYGPENAKWTYKASDPDSFFSSQISGAQRLSNGNTQICDGDSGLFFEVDSEDFIVWSFTNYYPSLATNQVFKTQSYDSDYPGLEYLIG
jgi:hypothetical protein